MNRILYRIKRFFVYRKLKKAIFPVIKEPASQLVDTKHISLAYILPFLVDLVTHKSDASLIIDDSLEPILKGIEELRECRIYTPQQYKYQNLKANFIFCTPLSNDNFDILYSRSIIDKDNYYIFLL